MKITLPEYALVTLVGISGSGKSTFAKKHFKPTEIISSDYCRALASDDENDQSATADAFDILKYIASIRLKNKKLTVIDATNIQEHARKENRVVSSRFHAPDIAIVLNLPAEVCVERNKNRTDREINSKVTKWQRIQLKKSLRQLKREKYRQIYVLNTPEEVEAVTIVRQPMPTNYKEEKGPFDIIGDVHGCYEELVDLLKKLGYQVKKNQENALYGYEVIPPEGRKAVFVGDYVDRGPQNVKVLKLVMSMQQSGVALCVPGNHDDKLKRKLSGRNVQLKHGLAETVAELEKESEEFRKEVHQFLKKLPSHLELNGGRLVIAHAGLKANYHGRTSGKVWSFCLYGETTGKLDKDGLPERIVWAKDYLAKPLVVYGHTPVPEAEWINNTIDIDTGCVFGGKLTALRYPELDLVDVSPRRKYYDHARPIRPLLERKSGGKDDGLLDLGDVLGRNRIETRLMQNIVIQEENAMAALEVMSRFAIHPNWLIYLPPTMSPTETSKQKDWLEYPDDGLKYYKGQGIEQVVCEEKHMGSRAVVVVCKDETAAEERFGVKGDGIGVCYTRSGRSFFTDKKLEAEFLAKVRDGLTKTNFWEDFQTNWVLLDCELMPWSAKARALLENQYASVGTAAEVALTEVVKELEMAEKRGLDVPKLKANTIARKEMVGQYRNAYRQYCWPVASLDDYKLAPFHLMATEGKVYFDQTHEWHMKTIRQYCSAENGLFFHTQYKIIGLS